jgi:hypothetical protein
MVVIEAISERRPAPRLACGPREHGPFAKGLDISDNTDTRIRQVTSRVWASHLLCGAVLFKIC